LIVILSAFAGLSDKPHVFRRALLLGAPAFVIHVLMLSGVGGLVIPGLVLNVLFFVFIFVMLFRHILHSKVVEAEILYGAVSCYFLIGYVWAFLNQILYVIEPASFSFAASKMVTGYDFLYYSFVSLTTLGYGDITPTTDYGKSLAMVEAVVGVFYMALVVARLVSLYGAESKSKS